MLAISLINDSFGDKVEGVRGKIPNILGTMAEDAMRCFLIIFTSYPVLEMTLTLGWVSVTAPLVPTASNDTRCVSLTRKSSATLITTNLIAVLH